MDFTVRNASSDELDIAIEWAAAEGWNPGLHDAEAFYAADPKAFFLGFLDDEPVASISAVDYGGTFGFVGFYIVKPQYRGRGYGIRIWYEAMDRLQAPCIGLDGVLEQRENYARSGFKEAYRNSRYEGYGLTPTSHSLTPLDSMPLTELDAYDRRAFPAARKEFLRFWISQSESLALGKLAGDKLAGYGVIRRCRTGYKIGPLFADDADTAGELLKALLGHAGPDSFVYLDVPEVNATAVSLAKGYGMTPKFHTARMYRGSAPDLDIGLVYGISTLELG